MRSIETSFAFPLSAVKPLDRLLDYRKFCLDAVRHALQSGADSRPACPACDSPAKAWGQIEDLEYARCTACNTLFLRDIPGAAEWAKVLEQVSRRRNSPEFHEGIIQSRTENVYEPKLDWINNTLRLQGIENPRLQEITISPNPFTKLLTRSALFDDVKTVEESDLVSSTANDSSLPCDVAVMLESLDRARDPARLLRAVTQRLRSGGLVFVTALVSSGFDVVVLGTQNRYLCPPDRANCFSLQGLENLLSRAGYKLVELSTPGVLDVEIVAAHLRHIPDLKLSPFEERLLSGDGESLSAFQSFLQQNRMSSFARIVARKNS